MQEATRCVVWKSRLYYEEKGKLIHCKKNRMEWNRIE